MFDVAFGPAGAASRHSTVSTSSRLRYASQPKPRFFDAGGRTSREAVTKEPGGVGTNVGVLCHALAVQE